MIKVSAAAGLTTWSVTVTPSVHGDVRWRSRLLEAVKPQLRCRLERRPAEQEFVWTECLLEIRARRVSGVWQAGSDLRLVYRDEAPNGEGTASATGSAAALPSTALPDERLTRLDERLVGVEGIVEDVLLQLRCHWDGLLDRWSAATGRPAPVPLQAQLAESVPLFLFSGDPGVGKSACAHVIADRYCREAGVGGRLLRLTTEVRGNGLVGDFGSRVRAAFSAARRAAMDGPSFLLLDEAEALAMRRSEGHAHQEDRAGTATLLQALDELESDHRVAVFLTTNLLETVDAAVRRRGTAYVFGRPDERDRGELFRRWFPEEGAEVLARAAQASEGMTPLDLDRALRQACLRTVRTAAAFTPQAAMEGLKDYARTGRV